ncbi:MAG: hypothetical protein LBQ66_05360 [Planctomycetaceae bacterium]|nr:hypothetical protein [Planctomycetaceae bacterium]
MILTEANIKLWSRIGSRPTFGLGVIELAKVYDDLLVISSDVVTSAGLEPFCRNYPGQHIDVGIAEQNMIGIAAGLASEGFRVITTTFAPFQTMRCCEQIRVNLGYMQQKVCMVGLGSGLVLGTQGFTHCCFEDVAVLSGIPNLTIISPADCGEIVKALFAAIEHNQSVYIRLTGGQRNPIVYHDDYNFKIGKAITLTKTDRNNVDVTIIAAGSMVFESLESAKLLEADGISASVVNMHTIKPLDTAVIDDACLRSKLIVTVEEHNVIGGLGSAVACYKTSLQKSPPQIMIGIPDSYCKPGDYQYLLNHYGLKSNQIAEKIKQKITQ